METDCPRVPQLPDRLYFRIGEVSRLLGVEPYVIRFWETEFPRLSPKKSDSGQRLFKKSDVELLLQIKDLLYVKHYTIEGARNSLNARRKDPVQQALFGADLVPAIKKELEALLDLLGDERVDSV